MRHEDARHRLFPVGLYATLLIGLFGVTFPELLAPVEAGARTVVTLPLRAYSILLDGQPAIAAEPAAEYPILDPTRRVGSGARGPVGHTPLACRVLSREVGPLGFVDRLELDVPPHAVRGAAPLVTSGNGLLGFLEPLPSEAGSSGTAARESAKVRVRLLHFRQRRRRGSAPLRVRAPWQPARIAAAVPCRETDAQGTLHFLVEPARAVDRWPLRCTLLDDSYLGSRLRTSGDVVTTVRGDDPRLPAGLEVGRLRIWGYPDHDIPVGLFVEPAVDPRAVSTVLVWLPGDGGATRSDPPEHELVPVHFTRFPAPRPAFERWMVTASASRVFPDGAALLDRGRLLGLLRQPWSGQSLVTPFAASGRAWSLLLKTADGATHELVGRVRGRDDAGRLRLQVLAAAGQVRAVGELYTGSNGRHCPAGIHIGTVAPGRWFVTPGRQPMSADGRRRDAALGELWVTLPDTPVLEPHVYVHGGAR